MVRLVLNAYSPPSGTLLRKLDNGMRGVSHVFVDEIHERDLNVSMISRHITLTDGYN